MATHWLSTLGVDDAGRDGLTYAQAFLTLEYAYSRSAIGDTLNVVNDGDHTMIATSNLWDIQRIGTDYATDPGWHIKGTDSSGNPAVATFKATITEKIICEVDDLSDYIWFQGIKSDYTALATESVSSMNGIEFSGHPRNFRIWDCECWFTSSVGSGATITNSNIPYLFEYTDSSVSPASDVTADVKNNVCVNARIRQAAWTKLFYDYHHNVCIFDADGIPDVSILMSATAGGVKTRGFYNNTLIMRRYGAEKSLNVIASASVVDTTLLDMHSNLLYVDCGPSAVTPGMLGAIFNGTNTAAVGTPIGIGYDVIALGVNSSPFYVAWTTPDVGISTKQFNHVYRAGGSSAGTDVDPNSVLLQNQAMTDVFNDDTATYDWTPDEYTHTLPYDLRPVVGEFAAMDGGTVGALPFKSDPIDPGDGDPGFDEDKVYIDSLPFHRPVLKGNNVTSVRIRRNKVRDHIDFRHYLTNHIYNESTHRRTIIGAGETVTLTYGGVDLSTLMMFSTDADVTAVVTFYNGTADDTFTTVVGEMLLLDQCQTRSVALTNSGSTDATVELVVFD